MVDPESDEDVYDDKLLSGSDEDDVMVDSEDENTEDENTEENENENEQRRQTDEETGGEQGEEEQEVTIQFILYNLYILL